MSQIVFGPLDSRRFGRSLGVDLSPHTKQCNYDCVYCELERKSPMLEMKSVISVEQVLSEIEQKYESDIDVLTITANGEPTLYPHLKELISKIKARFSAKTLILSNGSRFKDAHVQEALMLFDIVKFSFDGGERKSFKKIDRPHKDTDLESIKRGIIDFSKKYKGELVAEILLVKGHNDSEENLLAIANFINEVQPKRVDVSTIDRPPAYDVKALSYGEMTSAFDLLSNNIACQISLPSRIKIERGTLSVEDVLEIIKRRPLEMSEAEEMLGDKMSQILKTGLIKQRELNGLVFLTKP